MGGKSFGGVGVTSVDKKKKRVKAERKIPS